MVSLKIVRCYLQEPNCGYVITYSNSMCRESTHTGLNWKLPVQENLVKGILALELSLRIYFCYADLDYGQQLGGGTGNFAYTLCECWLLS